MINVSADDVLEKVNNRYTLVNLVAKRARDIVDGKPLIITDTLAEKPVTMAAEEIVEEEITYREVAEEVTVEEEVVVKEDDCIV